MNAPPLQLPPTATAGRTATVAVIKMGGRFKAFVGDVVEYGDYATIAARTAAAKYFGVAEAQIEVEPEGAVLTVRVKPSTCSGQGGAS